MKLVIFILSTTLILGGCSGGSVSVSSDQTQSASTSSNSIIERIKGIFSSKSTSVKVEMQISSLIVKTSKEWLSEHGIKMESNKRFTDEACIYDPRSVEIHGLKGVGLNENIRNGLAQVEKMNKDDWTPAHYQGLESARSIVKANEAELCVRLMIVNSADPIMGWIEGAKNADLVAWMLLNGLVANTLETNIANSMQNSGDFKSETVAKAKINNLLDGYAKDGVAANAIGQAVNHLLTSNKVIDSTQSHPAPVRFTSGEYEVQGASNGIAIIKDGGAWFGDGYLSGKKYIIAL